LTARSSKVTVYDTGYLKVNRKSDRSISRRFMRGKLELSASTLMKRQWKLLFRPD
jgi:hypothetical protein